MPTELAIPAASHFEAAAQPQPSGDEGRPLRLVATGTRGEWSRKTKVKVKKQLLVAVMIVGVLALAGSLPAYAQGSPSKVTVPFQFIVGETVLPAGSYVVTNVADRSDIVAIQSVDGKLVATAFLQATGIWSQKPNALFSFQKIGGRYFLSEVSIPGSDARAISLPRQRVEAMLVKLNGAKAPVGPAL